MQLGQGWRTENSNRYFPFKEGSTIPKDFISDIKYLHDRRGPEEVYLSSVSLDTGVYTLEFKFSSDDAVSIVGDVDKAHGLKQVHLFGENEESVVVFSTGASWDNPPENIDELSGEIDSSLVSSGPSMIRRIIIEGEGGDESSWRKETVQTLKGGTNVNMKLVEADRITPAAEAEDFIEISAVYGGGEGAPAYEPGDGILTINGISPNKGNINIRGFDCIKVIDKPSDTDHTIKVMSECLPCCGCSSYQLVSDAITYRSQQLAALCTTANSILSGSVDTYNAAVLALADSQTPVARIRAIRVYADRVKVALQNVCALPIYGRYGVSFSIGGWTNISPPNVPVAALPAPAKYNSYFNPESGDIPSGTYTGTVGPINPGGFVDLIFRRTGTDLRTMSFNITTESNGYFGASSTLGCQKDSYSASISPDTSIEADCNASPDGVRYQITNLEAP